MKWFATISGIVVVVVVIIGLVVSGSPSTARQERADNARETHLQDIYYDIHTYYRIHKELPESLQVMEDAGTYRIPHDPLTGESYEYRILEEKSFELCATFSFASEQDNNSRAYPMYPEVREYPIFNKHDQGRACFEAQIEEELTKTP